MSVKTLKTVSSIDLSHNAIDSLWANHNSSDLGTSSHLPNKGVLSAIALSLSLCLVGSPTAVANTFDQSNVSNMAANVGSSQGQGQWQGQMQGYPQGQNQALPQGQARVAQPVSFRQTAQAAHASGADLFPLNTTLDATDLKILQALSKQGSKDKQLTDKPLVTAPGQVSFIFGASRPTLVCSLLHVCDIALEPGENVVDIKAGDIARWIIERSASGSPEGIVEHITVKPIDTGLSSNLRIYTDRRTYNIDLKSSTQDFMPSIRFIYPENSLRKYAQIKNQLQQHQAAVERDQVQVGSNNFNLTDLNFNYEITGDESIRPLRVFNDQRKTYIQMSPQLMRQGRLPALVAVHETGGWFSSEDKTAIINYRIQDNNFVIDGLYPHLRLVLGQQSDHAVSVDIKALKS